MTDYTITKIEPVERLEETLRNQVLFEDLFKSKTTKPEDLGAGFWKWIADKHVFRLVTPNGSTINLRFYDAIKRIYDVKKNQEVPGRESFISYVEVVVYPAGIKPYMFKAFPSQAVWAGGHITAKAKHDASIEKLRQRFLPLGIDVQEDQWDNRYDRSTGSH